MARDGGASPRGVAPEAAALAVTLTRDELAELVAGAVRAALEDAPASSGRGAVEVLTLEETARLLRCSRHRVSLLVRDHGCPGSRVGQEWRFVRRELMAWLRAQQSGAAPVSRPKGRRKAK